jgi:hypothetical protein
VSVLSKNDADVLKLPEDLRTTQGAERLGFDSLSEELERISRDIKLAKETANKYCPQKVATGVACMPLDTSMQRFLIRAEDEIAFATGQFNRAKSGYIKLLEFFGEDTALAPEVFSHTINSFVSTFSDTCKEMKRNEEAKVSLKQQQTYCHGPLQSSNLHLCLRNARREEEK